MMQLFNGKNIILAPGLLAKGPMNSWSAEMRVHVVLRGVYNSKTPFRQNSELAPLVTWFCNQIRQNQWPLLLTWFNFNPSMDK